MENSVSVNNQGKLSDASLFWLCVFATVGAGLAISYSSGILGRLTVFRDNLPFIIPKGWVIAMPPILFTMLGVSLFFVLRENVYNYADRITRSWTWAFWLTLFAASAITPYFIYYGMPVAAYILSAITVALSTGYTILGYRASTPAGAIMTVYTMIVALIMVYLGFWAFA